MKIVVSVSPNKQQLHQHGLFETFSSSKSLWDWHNL